MAAIEVTRETAPWRDRARSYKVLIDGRHVGSLRQGDAATYTVEPGTHTVQTKIDWCTSRKLSVEVPGDGGAHLVCRPGHSSWTALFDAILRPSSYIDLETAEQTRSANAEDRTRRDVA